MEHTQTQIGYMTGMIVEDGQEKINNALSKAYDYFTNVAVKQNRFLDDKDMIDGYYAMHFSPCLIENVLKDLLVEMKQALAKATKQ